MLYTIGIILLILWLLGFVAFPVLGGFVHILLVIGIAILIYKIITG